ncbi:MAG: glycosyltransferase [Aeromicrobium sp.]|nr:glycosyltransferase [Burkholderiales bacterium]
MNVLISVIIPTHNPHVGRLRRTLKALREQTLASHNWDLILVDNASSPPVHLRNFIEPVPLNMRLVVEPKLGLTAARRRGFAEVGGELIVLVDDDNELDCNYLTHVMTIFANHSCIGSLGGKISPEFEVNPPQWMREFDGILACRDYGDAPHIISGHQRSPNGLPAYPAYAPIGAGMAVRRVALQPWLDDVHADTLSDRRGMELTSGGDNDIIFTLAENGWAVGYFPELALTHLIAAGRTTTAYLARLNHGIQKSWMHLLAKHKACPWPAISAWTVPPRKAKAWVVYRAWESKAAYVRWRGACGHFEGRVHK